MTIDDINKHALSVARVVLHEYINDCETSEAIEQIFKDYELDITIQEGIKLYYWVCGRLRIEPYEVGLPEIS